MAPNLTRFLQGPPQPVDPALIADPGNAIIDWLGLKDTDGGLIAKYKLHLEPGYSLWHQMYGFFTDLMYLFYQVMAAYGTAMLDWPLKTDQWLTPLVQVYNRGTAHIYSAISPIYLVAITFSVMLLTVYARRGDGMANQMNKVQWQRIGSALVLTMVVAFLAANPFRVVQIGLEAFGTLASIFTDNTGNTETTTNTTATENTIRTVSFLINYGGVLDPECAAAWSAAQNAGGANPDCLSTAQTAALDPTALTVAYAALALGMGWYLLKLGKNVIIKLAGHLSLFVALLISIAYVAALSLGRRRPYDPMGRTAARAATQGLLSGAILFVAIVLRAWLLELATWNEFPVFIQLALQTAIYWALSEVLIWGLKNKESVYSLFKQRIEGSSFYHTLHPGSAPTAIETLMQGTLERPANWITDQYRNTHGWATDQWNRFINGAGTSAAEGSTVTASGMIPDTPESDAATERVNLLDPTLDQHVIIDPSRIASAPGLGVTVEAGQAPQPFPAAVSTYNQNNEPIIITGQTIQPDPAAAIPQVWFRGGVPQLAPTAPPAPSAPTEAASPIQAPAATDVFEGRLSAYWQTLEKLSSDMRSHANALHHSGAPETADDLSAITAATYRQSTMPGQHVPPTPQQIRPPTARTVLDTAEWRHRFNHSRKLLQANGIQAKIAISALDEIAQDLVFETDSAGRNRVAMKHGRGFGDFI